ncbi:MAG: hypothetical protein ABH842_03875 [Candidatus Micrarchaeota archaeon]
MNRIRFNGRGSHLLADSLSVRFGDTKVSDTVIRRRLTDVVATIKMDRSLPPFLFGFSRGDKVLMVEPPHQTTREAHEHEKRAFVGMLNDTLTDARIRESRAGKKTYPAAKSHLARVEFVAGMVEGLLS